jgi:hypothetical protein
MPSDAPKRSRKQDRLPRHLDPSQLARQLEEIARKIDPETITPDEANGFLLLLLELSGNLSRQVAILRERLDRLERMNRR